MSGHKLRVWIVVLSILVFGGCQQGIRITVKDLGDRSPTFILEPASLLAWDEAEFTVFTVIEYSSDWKVWNVVWSIVSADMEPKRVHEVKYGTLPDGFREHRPAQQLLPGQTYHVRAEMAGKIGGHVSFVPR